MYVRDQGATRCADEGELRAAVAARVGYDLFFPWARKTVVVQVERAKPSGYRGLVQIKKSAAHARNFSQCDSLLIGDRCGAHTFPYLEIKNSTAKVEHEASTSKIGEDQIFYCRQRGISTEDAVNMIVSGFCKDVFRELPMEFAVEAQKLLGISLEGSVG